MATAREHMAADMAAILADTDEAADLVTLDGQQINVIMEPVDESASRTDDGLLLDRVYLWALTADLAAVPVPNQRLTIDGVNYDVELVRSWPAVVEIVMQRYWS